ncbi:DUF4221 family protein [Pedobacter sp. L105]|uniref:DUF4221 family protein n=1 Tax=Pedobacter sp. L105 TaxID=1641871 RepID=UPI00131CE964|nr:DUF4221 family protein [Pedobacter sp. L105]
MKQYYPLIFCVFLIVVSCRHKSDQQPFYTKKNSVQYEDKSTLAYKDCLELPADTSTTSDLPGIDIFKDRKSGKTYLSFLSPVSKSILIYDYDAKICIKKIPLFVDGPNGTNPNTVPSMIKMLSLDTVAYFNFDHLYLLNGEGTVLKKFNLGRDASSKESKNESFIAKPNPGTYSPIVHYGDDLILMCSYNSMAEPQTMLKDIIKINYKTGKKSAYFNRPQIFDYGYWGYNEKLYYLYGALNTKENKVILGYAAEPFLYSYDLKNNRVKKEPFIGSQFFEEINPFLKNREDVQKRIDGELMAKSAEHEICNPSYYAIFYDDKSDTYIRAAFLPRTKEEYRNPEKRFKFKCTFLLFDHNFNKTGEQVLPDFSVLDFRLMFMLNGYLHVLNREKYNNNNDKLFFDRYQIVKKP